MHKLKISWCSFQRPQTKPGGSSPQPDIQVGAAWSEQKLHQWQKPPAQHNLTCLGAQWQACTKQGLLNICPDTSCPFRPLECTGHRPRKNPLRGRSGPRQRYACPTLERLRGASGGWRQRGRRSLKMVSRTGLKWVDVRAYCLSHKGIRQSIPGTGLRIVHCSLALLSMQLSPSSVRNSQLRSE